MQPSDRLPALPGRFVILSAGGLGLSRRSRRTPIVTQNPGVVIPSAARFGRSRGTCGFSVALRPWFRASLQDRPPPECLSQQNPASPANHQPEGRHNRSPARRGGLGLHKQMTRVPVAGVPNERPAVAGSLG
jgi:hypothetical protein